MENISLIITYAVYFLALGGFVVYTIMKLKKLEEIIWNFPSPEEMAKEVLKVKIPLNELPPSALNKLKGMGFVGPGFPPNPPNVPPPEGFDKVRKSDYIG